MVVGGGVLDYRAGSRAAEMAQARDERDGTRVDELESSAQSARMANIGLYAGGGLLIASGLVLFLIDFSGDVGEGKNLSLRLSPGGIGASFSW